MDIKKLDNLINILNKSDITNYLYGFIDDSGSKKSINDVIQKITGDNKFCIELQDDIKSSIQLGQGAVNQVKYLGKDYIIRYTKDEFDLKKLVIFETETTIEDVNTGVIKTKKKYILSDALYDIIIQSIISKRLGKYPNFNMYFGSFYCSNNKKMYSVIEKNDITLLKFFININEGTIKNTINLEFLFNILFQYACICYSLYENGIIDFDRHLDNIMLKKIGSFSGSKDIYNTRNENIYTIGKDNYLLKNITDYVVPIDFGISIYTSPKYDIYNENKQYNKTHDNCTSTFTQIENIKAKYALINTEIHSNVMFFFFLRNLMKLLNNLKKSSNITNKQEIEEFINIMKTIFNLPQCGNILEDYEFRDDNKNPLFYLYRNIGVPTVKMPNIIDTIYRSMKNNKDSNIRNMILKS